MSTRTLGASLGRKALSLLLLIGLVFIGSRLLIRALPGDPIETIIAESGSSIPIEQLKEEFGLHLPWYQSLTHDLREIVLNGNWGFSLQSREPVSELLIRHAQNTWILGSSAFALGILLSMTLASGAALGIRWLDRLCTLHSAFMGALPTPWLGPILAYILAVQIPIFEITGAIGLPLLLLTLNLSAFWSRLLRSRLKSEMHSDVARYARAKGLRESKILIKHALAPSLGFFLAYFGTQLGQILAGSVITEILFDWPGLGTLFIQSVLARDYPLVEGCIFLTGTLILVFTRIGDTLHALWDPR